MKKSQPSKKLLPSCDHAGYHAVIETWVKFTCDSTSFQGDDDAGIVGVGFEFAEVLVGRPWVRLAPLRVELIVELALPGLPPPDPPPKVTCFPGLQYTTWRGAPVSALGARMPPKAIRKSRARLWVCRRALWWIV